MEWVNWYLFVGIVMGEAVLYDDRKNGRVSNLCQYATAVLLGPIMIPIVLLKITIRRKRK